jgi:hypothetical protein
MHTRLPLGILLAVTSGWACTENMSVENKGAVRFAASTSGGDLDFDGYEVMVDNGRTLPCASMAR